ncbi:hypothetical protein [Desulfofundulus sp.]|uniref:hypothetical protein n=1 Tax=Desulfofundulus sp. TaxID=2282750 RepID=UPI003C724332
MSFQYRFLQGLLERMYGSNVVVTYRFDRDLAPDESPVVLIEGIPVLKGGLAPVPVVKYLNRLGISRNVPPKIK